MQHRGGRRGGSPKVSAPTRGGVGGRFIANGAPHPTRARPGPRPPRTLPTNVAPCRPEAPTDLISQDSDSSGGNRPLRSEKRDADAWAPASLPGRLFWGLGVRVPGFIMSCRSGLAATGRAVSAPRARPRTSGRGASATARGAGRPRSPSPRRCPARCPCASARRGQEIRQDPSRLLEARGFDAHTAARAAQICVSTQRHNHFLTTAPEWSGRSRAAAPPRAAARPPRRARCSCQRGNPASVVNSGQSGQKGSVHAPP